MHNESSTDLKAHIRRVLENVEPELLVDETSQLTDQMESSLAAYAAQLDVDFLTDKHEELKKHRQETLKKSIAIALNAVRNLIERQTPESRAENRLRGFIGEVLDAVDMKLTEDEKSKIEDRMIRLLDDYARAPSENKDAVYSRGEQEVFSALDPPARSRGASAQW